MEADSPADEPTLLSRLRNMWQFANLAQYIHFFGDVLKIDKDFDIEILENECLKPQPSEKLPQIGLALLKHVSSFKGLTPDIFDEYTRRQYMAKAPHRNPFGIEEAPNKFNDFDVVTKIKVLQQLSLWTLNNPNTIRERLNATDSEQTTWRIEPYGWDSEDRTLILLDDNRLYRQTDPPPPPEPSKPKPKPKPKKTRGTRNSKRFKPSTPEADESIIENDDGGDEVAQDTDDGLGGMKWECLCITLEDYHDYINSMRKSKDPNEKDLITRLQVEVIPEIESRAEEKARQEARRAKEREVELKLATAKRSSRIAHKIEKQKHVDEAEEEERKRLADLAMAKAEQDKQRKLEEESNSRRQTREQRIREREAKRILHEEELRKMKEESEQLGGSDARLSERHLVREMKRRQQELEEIQRLQEDEWFFDCEVCGAGGDKFDDGSHSIACEKCNVWQHSKCHGITEKRAERDDFHFVCKRCIRKEEEAKLPKLPPLKLRLSSTSPNATKHLQPNGITSDLTRRPLEAVSIPIKQPAVIQPTGSPTPAAQPLLNGPSLSPRGQSSGPPGIRQPDSEYRSPQVHLNGNSPSLFAHHYPSFPASSPPQSSHGSFMQQRPYSQSNGTPHGAAHPFIANQNSSFGGSFSRPASSAGPGHSPVKHSPAPSPRPTNGISNSFDLAHSPHSSFPPSSHQRLSFSPMKHSSPPPLPPLPASSPGLGHVAPSPSPTLLPNPVPAPEKHDAARPFSSHSMSETPIWPPIKTLSPSAKPQILSPPTKKSSPTPDRPQFVPVSGNGTQQ